MSSCDLLQCIFPVSSTPSRLLMPQEGKIVSKSKVKDAWGMPEGAELEMGNWELQVDAKMDEQQFRLVFS